MVGKGWMFKWLEEVSVRKVLSCFSSASPYFSNLLLFPLVEKMVSKWVEMSIYPVGDPQLDEGAGRIFSLLAKRGLYPLLHTIPPVCVSI